MLRHPTDIVAITTARQAAERLGDHSLAQSYSTLSDALAGPVNSDVADEGELAEVTRLRVIESGPEELYAIERPSITLDDVGGLGSVKKRLEISFLAPLRNPELRVAFGKSLRGGLLLYGPPGCGKTYIARALAGEVGASFFAVGLSDVLDMWMGESERKLHEIFELARRNAPCVLFIDEIDALGQKRSQIRFSPQKSVVSQLLSELDGTSDNEGVYLLGATNHPWDVDTALRRPGRLDQTLLVLPPDEPARQVIVTRSLEGRPVSPNLDVRAVVKRTGGYSGADLVSVCEVATELALEDSIRDGVVRPITSGDLVRAVKQVKPSTRPWFEIAYNYATFANEGGQYDDLLSYIRTNRLHG